MRLHAVLLTIAVMAFALALPLFAGSSQVKNRALNSRGQDVRTVVSQLRSADPNVRKAAKEEVLRFGDAAIPALLEVLKLLVDNQNRLPALEQGPEELKKLDREVNAWTEVREDVCQLLVALRATEAIPLLIRNMEERRRDNVFEKCRPDMETLVRFGESAVPGLIKSIEGAEATSARNQRPGGNRREGTWISPDISAVTIQIRAAEVLGDIGDIRALIILEKLGEKERLAPFWYAIQLIKKKNGLDYEQPGRGELTGTCH